MSKKRFMKTTLSMLLALVMVFNGLGNIGISPIVVEAASASTFREAVNLTGGSYTTLSTGYYYVTKNNTIPSETNKVNVTYNASGYAGTNAITISSGATVVIEIPKYVTLTLTGGSASGRTSGGAGLYIPSNAKVYIIGEGTLDARGGSAAGGSSGSSGNAPYVDNGDDEGYGGSGGSGGSGGGGAGAGIGTSGGQGGSGGSGASRTNFSYDRHSNYKWYYGSSGGTGGTGSASASMGTLYVLGNTTIKATGGSASSSVGSAGSNNDERDKGDYYKVVGGTTYGSAAGGGGGAGGGSGYYAANIGSGGSGAGGGGGGGAGGARCDDDDHISAKNMWGGSGSGGTGYYSGYSNYRAAGKAGGYGGSGGGSSNAGTGGKIYKASTANVAAVGGASSGKNGRGATVYTGNYKYNVTLKLIDKGNGLQGPTQADFGSSVYTEYADIYIGDTEWNTLSAEFSHTGYTLEGFYADEECSEGKKVLNADGSIAHSSTGDIDGYTVNGAWHTVKNTTLYAKWTPNKYNLTFHANGGFGQKVATVTYDAPYPKATDYAGKRTGYHLLKYTDDKAGKGNVVYNATMNKFSQEDDSKGKEYIFPDNSCTKDYYTTPGDTVIYAQWEPIHYTINFWTETNDGTTICIGTYPYEDVVYDRYSLPNINDFEYEREHYIFQGWNIYSSQNWSMYKANTAYAGGLAAQDGAVVDAYAAWEVVDSFTISYQGNGGIKVPPSGFAFAGDDYQLSDAIPVRDGYIFLGWSTSVANENVEYEKGDIIPNIQESQTLYAVWKKNNSVSYNINGGIIDTAIETIYPAKGEEYIISSSVPYRTGYKFKGWSTSSDATTPSILPGDSATMGDTSVVYYAVWERDSFSATFIYSDLCEVYAEDDLNTAILTDEFKYGEDYTFIVSHNASQIKKDKMQVTADGSLLLPISTENINGNTLYTYTIKGATNNLNIIIDGLEKLTYAIAYDTDGGILSAPMNSYVAGETATLPIPVKDGYSFDGWYYSVEGEITETKIEEITNTTSGNLVLKAKWSPIEYKVSYNINNGINQDKVGETIVSYNQIIILPGEEIVNADNAVEYNFLGWSLDEASETAEYDAGQKVTNLSLENDTEVVLYAVWDIPRYTINFDLLGGTVDGGVSNIKEAIIQEGNATSDLSSVIPVKEGYNFAGWTDGTNNYESTELVAYRVNKDTTLTAKWTANTYSIALHGNGGVDTQSNETIYLDCSYDEIKILESNSYEKPDCEFLGWATTDNATVPEYMDGAALLNVAGKNSSGETYNLYAIWSEDETAIHYITYNLNGGNATSVPTSMTIVASDKENPTEAEVKIGASYVVNDDIVPERLGYQFVGWTVNGPSSNQKTETIDNIEDKNYTLYAIWVPDTYTITYMYTNPYSNDSYTYKEEFGYNESVIIKDYATIDEWMNGDEQVEGTLSAPELYIWSGWTVDADNRYEIGSSVTPNANITIVTTWKRSNSAKLISYDINGGDTGVPGSSYFEKNSQVELEYTYDEYNDEDDTHTEKIPSKKGYTFIGWSESPIIEIDESGNYTDIVYTKDGVGTLVVSRNVVLYAVWEQNPTYKITYNVNADGADDNTIPYDFNEYYEGDVVTVDFNSVPSRQGYDFLGWDTNENATIPTYPLPVQTDSGAPINNLTSGENSYEITIEQENVSLYAVWKPGTYQIEYYNKNNLLDTVYGLDINNAQMLKAFTEFTSLTAPTGYEFAGWAVSEGGEVSYEGQDAIAPNKVVSGSTLKLYMVWKPIDIKLTLVQNNGDDNIVKSFAYGDNLPSNVNLPNKPGYVFEGYFYGDEMYYDAQMKPVKRWSGAENLTLNAKWRVKTFAISYCNSVGTVIYEKEYSEGTQENLASSTELIQKHGYIIDNDMSFIGWSDTVGGDVAYSDESSIKELDVTGKDIIYLFAVEKSGKKCYIHYNSNGGIGGPSGYTVTAAGERVKLNFENIPVREGYLFLGWSEDATAIAPSYIDAKGSNQYITSESQQFVTMYAVWKKLDESEIDWSDKKLLAILTNVYSFECNVNEKPSIDGLIVVALYTEGSSRLVTDYKTNLDDINFDTPGTKKLKISYTENGITKELYIPIEVIGKEESDKGGEDDKDAPEGDYDSPTGLITQEEVASISNIYDVKPETAVKIIELKRNLNLSDDVIAVTNKSITSQKSEDIKGATFSALLARATKNTKNSITLKWKKVPNADGYVILGNKCGTKNKYKVLKTLSANKTSYTHKKLKKGTYYKYVVRAYKLVDGKKVTIAVSSSVHSVTKGGKYGVAKSVKVNKTKVTLNKNKTFKIKAKEIKKDKKIRKHRKLKYESSNKKIATVTSKGVIKAKKKGTCYVYVYAQNGIYKRIKVTVK